MQMSQNLHIAPAESLCWPRLPTAHNLFLARGALMHLFQMRCAVLHAALPRRYNTRLPGGINGGVLLLRPCPAMLQHMVHLLDTQPKLRFAHGAAEQDFFTW